MGISEDQDCMHMNKGTVSSIIVPITSAFWKRVIREITNIVCKIIAAAETGEKWLMRRMFEMKIERGLFYLSPCVLMPSLGADTNTGIS